jgi:hypothetical protein
MSTQKKTVPMKVKSNKKQQENINQATGVSNTLLNQLKKKLNPLKCPLYQSHAIAHQAQLCLAAQFGHHGGRFFGHQLLHLDHHHAAGLGMGSSCEPAVPV